MNLETCQVDTNPLNSDLEIANLNPDVPTLWCRSSETHPQIAQCLWNFTVVSTKQLQLRRNNEKSMRTCPTQVCCRPDVRSISPGWRLGEQREETAHNTHHMQANHIYIWKYGLVCVYVCVLFLNVFIFLKWFTFCPFVDSCKLRSFRQEWRSNMKFKVTLKGEITTNLKIENTTETKTKAFENQMNIQQVWLVMFNTKS